MSTEPLPEPTVGAPTPERPSRAPDPARKRRRALVFASASLAAALLIIGCVAGYFGNRAWASRQSLPDPAVVTAAPEFQGSSARQMPDIRGLDQAAAMQLLSDLGVTPGSVATSREPAAGPAGSVIDQSPASGTTDLSKVRLVLSEEAKVPEIKGRNGQELSVELQKMGAQVQLTNRYQPGAVAGTVIASDPPPGSALPQQVRLVVAEPGSSVYVSKVSAVSGGCSTGEKSLNGTDYNNSMSCSAGSSEPEKYEWVTKRAVDQLTATVGMSDDIDDPTESATVTVYADGRRVGGARARYGATTPLNVVTTGALRVTIVVTKTGGEDTPSVVLGDARFIGSADAIKKLDD